MPRLSLNKTSIVTGWFLITCSWSNPCDAIAHTRNTTARDQRMTKLKMAWSSARAHVSLIDEGEIKNTASFQFEPALIEVVPSLFVCFCYMIV